MGVAFNSCETGTICSSICNEKRRKFLFILLAIGKSSIKVDIYCEIDLVMFKISAFHYFLTMVVIEFSAIVSTHNILMQQEKGRAINPAFLKICYNEPILFHVSPNQR